MVLSLKRLITARCVVESWVISVLRFSAKMWQQHHRGLLSKPHLVVLDGLPVTKADGKFYKVNSYVVDDQEWELYPIGKADCIDDISLFDEVGD